MHLSSFPLKMLIIKIHTTEILIMIFFQRDPAKTPKGKTSEEECIMELLNNYYSKEFEQGKSDFTHPTYLKSTMQFVLES